MLEVHRASSPVRVCRAEAVIRRASRGPPGRRGVPGADVVVALDLAVDEPDGGVLLGGEVALSNEVLPVKAASKNEARR